jgi:TolA-binding protein
VILWYLVQSSGVQLNSLSADGNDISGTTIAQTAIDAAHEKMQVPKILTPKEMPDEWCSNDLAMAIYLAELRWGINRRRRRSQGQPARLEPRAPVAAVCATEAVPVEAAAACAEDHSKTSAETGEGAIQRLRELNEAFEEKQVFDSGRIRELEGRVEELEKESSELKEVAEREIAAEKWRADEAEKELAAESERANGLEKEFEIERDRADEVEREAERLREEVESMSQDLSTTQEKLEELREKLEENSSPGAQGVSRKSSAGSQDENDDVAKLIDDSAKAAAAAAAAWNVRLVLNTQYIHRVLSPE